MAYGLGINPLMMGVGGAFSSYDNYMPSMGGYGMGMMYDPMTSAYGMGNMYGGMGSMGMMGSMFNPLYFQQLQQQSEINQLQHAGNMHDKMKDIEVSNYGRSDRALIEKISQNGSVLSLLQNLVDKVQNRQISAVYNEYQKLQNQILNTYKDEIEARGVKENPVVLTREIIDQLYASVTKGSNLRDDIMKYGENAFENGYQQSYNPGHGTLYADEVINRIYGEDIGNAQSKEAQRSYGYAVGKGAHALKTGLGAGALVGAGSLTAAGLIKGTGCFVAKKPLGAAAKFLFKKTPAAAFGALLAGTIVDLFCPKVIDKALGIAS